MARPSKFPEWASTGGAAIVEPSEGKKDSGWAGGEKPRAQYFNWILNLIYLWLVWIGSSRKLIFNAASGYVGATAGWTRTGDSFATITTSTNPSTWIIQASFKEGIEITKIRFRVKPGGATERVRCRMYASTDDGSATTPVNLLSTAGTAWEYVDSGAISIEPAPGTTYTFEFAKAEGSAAVVAHLVEVTFNE